MPTYTEAYNWVLSLTNQSEDVLTYDFCSRFLESALRDAVLVYPAIANVAIAGNTNDQAYLWEMMGHEAGADIIVLPPEEGSEVVSRIKVASIEQVFKVPNLFELASEWHQRAAYCLSAISVVFSGVAADESGNPYLPGVVSSANPTKSAEPALSLFGNEYAQECFVEWIYPGAY